MGKTCNSGESSQEWLAYQNYSKSAMMTHPGGHKKKKNRITSKELQASLASIKVSVHDSTIRKRLGKNDIHARVPRKKPLLTKKNTMACLIFANNFLIIPKTFGQIFCGLMRLINFLKGVCPITSGVKLTQDFIKRTSYHQSNMVVVV